MANVTNNNYKAKFCRQFFYQLKGFVENFNLNKNNLGMEFLLEVYNNDPRRKDSCRWINSVIVEESDLMLAIEEFYAITNTNKELQKQRDDRLMAGLLEPDKFATEEIMARLFADDHTLKAILNYFGIDKVKKAKRIEDQITCFDEFASAAAFSGKDGKKYSINFYNNALHLFQYYRNSGIHNFFKKGVPQRKIAIQFLAFTYIGLTYLMRQTWKLRKDRLGNYIQPKDFAIPSQPLKITISTNDENDKIISYEFIPNTDNPSKKTGNNISPSNYIEIGENEGIYVRKYEKFKLSVTYRTPSGYSETVTFGKENDEKMLIYYYWAPTFEVHLPKISDLKPGITNTGNSAIDNKVAKLFEDANKQTDELLRECMLKATNDFLNIIQPKLDEIKCLNDNIQNLSAQQERHRKELEDNINNSLAKVSSEMESYLKDILSNTNTLVTEVGELNKKYKILERTSSDNQNEIIKLLDLLIKGQIRMQRQIDNIYKPAYCDLGLQNPSSANSSWLKRILSTYIIPLLGLLTCAAFLFGWGLYTYPFSLINNNLTGVVAVLLATFLEIFLLMWEKEPNIPSILGNIRNSLKSIGNTGYLKVFMAIVIWIIAVCLIPYSIASFDFASQKVKLNNKVKAAEFMQNYIDSDPIFDEDARIQLAYYYLNYTNDQDKAWSVTSPINSNPQKYKDGILILAEIIYAKAVKGEFHEESNSDELFSKITDLIGMYKSKFGRNIVTDRLEGIILMKGQGKRKDVYEGFKLLMDAANSGDAVSQYYFAYVLSHDMTDWDSLIVGSGNTAHISQMNIARAPHYYRCSIKKIPKAALDLGNLYNDLNMVDSAIYYYDLARKTAPMGSELYKETIFKLGLLHPLKDIDNAYLDEARYLDYAPALLLQANLTDDHKRAVALYKRAGTYKGHRYIPPIIFHYISMGKLDDALQCLNESRPEGKFDMNFVKGMELMLKKDKSASDSTLAMDYITESANYGCRYAQMLYIYRDMEYKVINRIPLSRQQIIDFDKYGKHIPFAYILESYIYKELGLYEESEMLGMKAVGLNHPAGALFLAASTSNQYNVYTEKMMKNEENCLLFNRIRQTALLSNPDKKSNIFLAYKSAEKLAQYVKESARKDSSVDGNKIFNDADFVFWSDVAIANKYFDFECIMLKIWLTGNDDERAINYREKLFSAALHDMKDIISDQNKSFLTYAKNRLSKGFVDQLENDFKGNDDVLKLLKSQDQGSYDGELSISSEHLEICNKLSDKCLLNEFSDIIEKNYYKNPVSHKGMPKKVIPILGTWRLDTIIESDKPDIKMEIYDEWILLSNNSCTKMQQRIPIISGKALEPSKPEVISQGRWSMKGDTIIILLPIKDDPKHRLVSKLMITENGLVVCGSGQRLEKVKENTQ